mgnify:CR=1 FL=1
MGRAAMADFLEERINGLIRMGASYVDDYAVDIVQTSGGQEYRKLIHPFPVRKFDISYLLDAEATWVQLQGIYHRAHGKYAGFRARCADEWSSNGRTGIVGPFDQPLSLASPGIYQLRKYYGLDKTAGAAGYAYRDIKKPVSGTVRAGISTTEIRSADWSIDTTTGRLTFSADQTGTITGITKAAAAVITFAAHTFAIGQSIQISGVAGMTNINGLRALVTNVSGLNVTVAINSTTFNTWTSGGVAHTRPQAGEAVTAGYEFDFAVRFNTTLPIGQDVYSHRSVDGVELIEILNP